jgi:PAS domain S-box-containing protein
VERTARANFTVDSAFQGQEGFEKIKAAHAAGRPYALAFVDVRMPPGWDGIETIENIWKVDPDVQVVVCTAYSDYSWADMIERLGHSDRLLILRKPFDNIEVLQLATALTEKWDLLQHARTKMRMLESNIGARERELEAALSQLRQSLVERERAHAELRKSEELFRMLSACSPMGIWFVDPSGQCRYANERWTVLSGLTTEQTIGDGWARALHPDDLPEMVQAWARVGAERIAREIRLRRPDGIVRWVFIQTAVIRSAQGIVTGQVATIEDITERKAMQQERALARAG